MISLWYGLSDSCEHYILNLPVAFHVRVIVSSLKRKSRDSTDEFAAVRLSEDTKENIQKVFVYRVDFIESKNKKRPEYLKFRIRIDLFLNLNIYHVLRDKLVCK